jgi:hypothetical protein
VASAKPPSARSGLIPRRDLRVDGVLRCSTTSTSTSRRSKPRLSLRPSRTSRALSRCERAPRSRRAPPPQPSTRGQEPSPAVVLRSAVVALRAPYWTMRTAFQHLPHRAQLDVHLGCEQPSNQRADVVRAEGAFSEGPRRHDGRASRAICPSELQDARDVRDLPKDGVAKKGRGCCAPVLSSPCAREPDRVVRVFRPIVIEARHARCSVARDMRTLEARFHPLEREGGGFVVVGHVIWEGPGERRYPRIEPAQSLIRLSAPATILSILRHLVGTTSPKTFERLAALKNRYWSFVDVPVPVEPVSSTRG